MSTWLEKYEQTIDAIWKSKELYEDKCEDVHSVQKAYVACADYLKSVCNHVLTGRNEGSMLAAGYIDREVFQANVQRRDAERRAMHNGLIAEKNMTNRICDLYGVEQIFPKTEDRDEIADMAGSVSLELFLVGTDKDEKQIQTVVDAYDSVKPIDRAVDEVVNKGKKIVIPDKFKDEERR